MVRACGSYPQCPGFNSLHRHHSSRHGDHQGIERDWGADRSGRTRATHGSPAAPRPAAKAEALDGRRLRRAIPCTATNLSSCVHQGIERASFSCTDVVEYIIHEIPDRPHRRFEPAGSGEARSDPDGVPLHRPAGHRVPGSCRYPRQPSGKARRPVGPQHGRGVRAQVSR